MFANSDLGMNVSLSTGLSGRVPHPIGMCLCCVMYVSCRMKSMRSSERDVSWNYLFCPTLGGF